MADYSGSALYLAFKGTAINADYRKFTPSEKMAMVDVAAGADTNKTYINALKDGTAKLELLDQQGGTAATAPYNLMVPGASGTLEWGPEGTATGKPRHYVIANVADREPDYPYDNAVMLKFSFQYNGVVTDTAY